MKTLKKEVISEIDIKNSRFITLLVKINCASVKTVLEEIKLKYPKATHYCYGYIYKDIKHFSDDGEPGGTAGMPILHVLEKENLNNILCVVVRYFGGIKLGTGGLVRAYTKAVTEALGKAEFLYLEKGYKIELNFNYNVLKNVEYLLKDITILEKRFDEKISFIVLIPENFSSKLHGYDWQILDEIYIEKEKYT